MVHEGNKDEAENCFNLAQNYFREGNREKALRIAQKAQRLFPSTPCKEFIELLNRLGNSTAGNTGTNDTTTSIPKKSKGEMGSQENLRQRQSGDESSASEYTTEQIEAVRKIKTCKDYYDILGCTKEATDSDLKKAYRKLALQFHPDKNKAPGATEAFKAVGNSFAVLSDPEKRKHYDLYGIDDTHSGSSKSHYEYSSSTENDLTAEELFNMFFGGGHPSGNVYVRRNGRWERPGGGGGYGSNQTRTQRHTHNNTTQQDQSGLSVILQLMPLLLILMLSLASSFFSSDPLYSLSPTNKYLVQRTTRNLGITFYVKQDFSTEFTGNLRKLEQHVEEDYIATLRNACYKERNYKENMIWRAKSFGDANLYRKANDLRTPSCDSLHDLYN